MPSQTQNQTKSALAQRLFSKLSFLPAGGSADEAPISLSFRLTRAISRDSTGSCVKGDDASVYSQGIDKYSVIDEQPTLPQAQALRRQGTHQNVFHSSGRGGAGNIRPITTPASPTSPNSSTAKNIAGSSDDAPYIERGREAHSLNVAASTGAGIVHVGRGGAGNMLRSFSGSRERDEAQLAAMAQHDRDVIERARANRSNVFATGRGGAGNFTFNTASGKDQR